MRIFAAFFIALVSVTGVLAQTAPPAGSSTVTVTVVTGANGTNGSLSLALSGTFPGDPFATTLDLPGDLQPGMTNTYSLLVPHEFCEIFQFKLMLNGADDWLGEQVSIAVNSVNVWYDGVFGESGAMTAGGWRSGTWDGTQAYRSRCAMTPVEVTFTTGKNGTVDNPQFELLGNFSAAPYGYTLNQPGDLQPGMTNTYDFLVPMSFCQTTGWHISKGTTGGVDDTWLANEIGISVNYNFVYFDKVLFQLGAIAADSQIGGTWDGTETYQSLCSPTVIPPDVLLTVPPLQLIPTVAQLPGGLALVTPVQINPQIIATPTPIPFDNGVLPVLATATSFPASAGVTQCQGAPPLRLYVGGRGRVTPGAPNRLRAQPDTSGAILTNIPAGGVFSVIGGPTCAGGYTWWQVNYNGIIGWTVEGSGAEYWTEPA